MKKILTMISILMASSLYAKPTVDIAILLDTSGSMQGLINQVRDGLWQTLNNLGEIKKSKETAELRLSLYEYGSGTVSAEANFIQMLVPLTSDHTLIAEKLFATKATGSQEFSGQAINNAVEDLKWSEQLSDFRSIVIAGNETINQGPTPALEASEEALSKEILVNSIFAGPETMKVFNNSGGGFGCSFCPNPTPAPIPTEPEVRVNPIFLEWKQLAKSGGGETLSIDHSNAIPYIESPFDSKIIKVTESISDTFLPFGKDGASEYQRMRDLDRQIRSSGSGSYIGWGDYRSGNFGQANTATWDLVSASRVEDFDITKIEQKDLPEALRSLSTGEKLAIIKKMDDKRTALETEAKELRAKRKVFVDEVLANQNSEDKVNFATAIKDIIVKQIKLKGFILSQD